MRGLVDERRDDALHHVAQYGEGGHHDEVDETCASTRQHVHRWTLLNFRILYALYEILSSILLYRVTMKPPVVFLIRGGIYERWDFHLLKWMTHFGINSGTASIQQRALLDSFPSSLVAQ